MIGEWMVSGTIRRKYFVIQDVKRSSESELLNMLQFANCRREWTLVYSLQGMRSTACLLACCGRHPILVVLLECNIGPGLAKLASSHSGQGPAPQGRTFQKVAQTPVCSQKAAQTSPIILSMLLLMRCGSTSCGCPPLFRPGASSNLLYMCPYMAICCGFWGLKLNCGQGRLA